MKALIGLSGLGFSELDVPVPCLSDYSPPLPQHHIDKSVSF